MKKFILFFLLAVICSATVLTAQKSDFNDFYNTERIQDVRLQFKQKNWKVFLDSLKVNGEEMLLGTLTIGAKQYKNVGIRYSGSKSFSYGGERNSFQVKLNQINKEQNHQGVTRLKLSNALRDPSMVREVLGYEIARKYMRASRANYTRMYVNGEYRGLYVNVEHVDGNFLTSQFGTKEGTLVKGAQPGDGMKADNGCLKNIPGTLMYEEDASCYLNNYELKSENGWDDVIALTKALSTNDAKSIEKILDVDQVLWMHAYNNVLVNLNSYAGDISENYYLYKNKHGKFVPIVKDLNLCFGSYKKYKFKSSSLTLDQLQNLDPFLHEGNKSKPLISSLLSNPYYKKLYISHVETIFTDNFLEGEYEVRAKALQELIKNDLSRDKFKYYDDDQFATSLIQTQGKKSKIPGIIELMSKRTRFLKKHPAIRGFAPEIESIYVAEREKFARKEVTSFRVSATVEKIAKKVRIYYRFNKDDEFKYSFMQDDGEHYDGKAADKVFGIEIKPEGDTGVMEYYIIAENAAGITCYPDNYMFEAKKVTLKELNK
jgi:hypothetical protein